MIEKLTNVTKKEKDKRGFVLAEGEHTGNYHTIEDDVELFEKNGTLYIKAVDTFTVKHQEHNPITVPPGEYEVKIALEYDHFLEESKKVQD